MKIELNDISKISKAMNLPFTEGEDWFKFKIEKEDHYFEIQLLKWGQYIFVSLFFQMREFQIEHFEFYMNETRDDVLMEFSEILYRLKLNESRVSLIKNWRGQKMKVEIKENNKWGVFGYLGKEFKRKANT